MEEGAGYETLNGFESVTPGIKFWQEPHLVLAQVERFDRGTMIAFAISGMEGLILRRRDIMLLFPRGVFFACLK